MRQLLTAGSAGAMLLALTASATAAGPKYTEMGDAGSLPGGAQTTVGTGGMSGINGGMGTAALLGAIDTEDMFLIRIVDPKKFRATTDPNDPELMGLQPFANFNSQIWIFKPTADPPDDFALGFLGNDDHPDLPGSLLSLLIPVPTDGSPPLVDPGLYYIAITRSNNDPDSEGGEIFFFDPMTPTEISGPDGPGGMMMLPISGWTGDPGGKFDGAYRIALRGVEFAQSPCPASSCDGDACKLTQSLDPVTNEGNQVACGEDGNTTENGWARCYNLEAEGVPAGANLTIESVTFGVQQASIDGINLNVVLYLDCNDCPPDQPGVDAIVLATVPLTVDTAHERTLIIVPMPPGTVVPAGTDLIVEIENVDDGTVEPVFAFRTMSNSSGQCSPSYIRAAACGIPGWADVADIGFPDAHLIQSVSATIGGEVTVACGPLCPWDLDNNGSVGATDLLVLLVTWGPCKGCPADFDGNGTVGATDLLALLVNWGPCP